MDNPKPIVLAVDDTPANLDVLSGILRDDYKVIVARDGPKALELAQRDPMPDVILLDIMMPGMSGYEVCEQLKADPETSSIPVIFITAKTQVEDEQKGLALGAVDYITKPFHPDIVKARLSRHLASHQKTRELIDENRNLRDHKPRTFTEFDEAKLAALIRAGEGHELEFKSTLRWNMHADRSDKNIENACLKTVAGYLNTDGGLLLIGVTDEGEPIGLNNDHFKSEDKLMLHWVDLVTSSLGAEFSRSIRSIVHTVGNQRVLVVECLPANAPVFFNRDNDESYYVRMTNSTKALKPREVLTYIGEHFADESSSRANSHNAAPEAEPIVVAEEAESHNFSFKPGWLRELQKRRVIRTAVLYVIIAFGIIEIALAVTEALEAPEWIDRFLVLGFIAGFPLVLVLSWIYDLRVKKTDSKESV